MLPPPSLLARLHFWRLFCLFFGMSLQLSLRSRASAFRHFWRFLFFFFLMSLQVSLRSPAFEHPPSASSMLLSPSLSLPSAHSPLEIGVAPA